MGRTVPLRRSPSLGLYLLALHLVAGASVTMAELRLPVRVLLALAVVAAASRGLMLWRRRGALGVEALRLLDDGSLWLRDSAGNEIGARVLPATRVFPRAAVILARPQAGGRTRAIAVVSDSCEADDFRTLKTWLRWRAEKAAAG